MRREIFPLFGVKFNVSACATCQKNADNLFFPFGVACSLSQVPPLVAASAERSSASSSRCVCVANPTISC